MNVDKYIVVGQYNCQNSEVSPVFAEVVDCLSILGNVNVFDMPVAKLFNDIRYWIVERKIRTKEAEKLTEVEA